MSSTIHTLNLLTLPLKGERLIEASAGTGKTYTLAALYLRLLLGLGGEHAHSRPLLAEEILVVTFTEAATEELRGRIRLNIHELRLACIRGNSANPLLAELLMQIVDKTEAVRLLLMAERQMDQAAIYTIHGFCQRMLSHNAFLSGMFFQQALLENELPLQRQACADFWRRHCYPLSLEIATQVHALWTGPEALFNELKPYLQGELPRFHQEIAEEETIEKRHQGIIAAIGALKAQWLEHVEVFESMIMASDVDKRSYSRRHLPQWLSSISLWAQQETRDYQLPEPLKRFQQSYLQEKTPKGTVAQHAVFVAIEQLLSQPCSLRDLLLFRALKEVRTSVQQAKLVRAEVGFDDLLSRLDQALQHNGGEKLAQMIRQHHPVAMIDEFQDTDSQQYRIFHRLYGGKPELGLLLIGDPKQAIYAFRGADIFTYLQARSRVDDHYHLETNWRSASGMVSAVNRIFSQVDAPFLFDGIPFFPVKAAEKNQALRFEIDNCLQSALQFWLKSGEGCSKAAYQQTMAQYCAAQIRDWLTAGQQRRALLYQSQQHSKPLEAADITVLVRSGDEAALIREALSALAIPSVYLSNRDNVFASPEARDLLRILQAILAPDQAKSLRRALAVGLLGLTTAELDALNHDEQRWDIVVSEFEQYRSQWQRYGVLPMLRELMVARHVAENLLASPGGERCLTNVLHIGELLQEASLQLDSAGTLVRWLAQQIERPALQVDNQQLRLESDRHLVQIVTIHKSKGLEFSVVCLPFIGSFRPQQQGIYHHRDTFQMTLDLQGSKGSICLAEEERLAEDLRLLYVALTRAIYHCSVGVAALFSRGRKPVGNTDLHRSAIGYLLQGGRPEAAAGLRRCLRALCGEHIALTEVVVPDNHPWQPQQPVVPRLQSVDFSRNMQDEWRVTSYSGLQRPRHDAFFGLLPKWEEDVAGEIEQTKAPQMTVHTFPKGAAAGTFLHALLQRLDFTQPCDLDWLHQQRMSYGLDPLWGPVLVQWLHDILHTPLQVEGPCLAQITPDHALSELQFYLPIQSLLWASELDALTKRYDPLSSRCPALDFRQVRGMLTGFIDLVFCWQERYYLLDYKSNWLGEEGEAYTLEALEHVMREHRYDLQYQLYALALHRYLQHRLSNYCYQHHFGGVYYCFLRGMTPQKAGRGVFYHRPDEHLIEGLEDLFGRKVSGEYL